jgi:hypothetical protein
MLSRQQVAVEPDLRACVRRRRERLLPQPEHDLAVDLGVVDEVGDRGTDGVVQAA